MSAFVSNAEIRNIQSDALTQMKRAARGGPDQREQGWLERGFDLEAPSLQ
jgi:hypothetical protein